MKKIAILFEKSKKIGLGHYFRSIRLYNLLKNKFIVSLFEIKNKKKIKKILKRKNDLNILDLKNYPKLNLTNKTIVFENLGKTIPYARNINPLDLHLENSGPEYFLYPENIEKIKYNLNYSVKKIIKILIIQGANDSNGQVKKLAKFLDTNKDKIKFKFKLIIKSLKKKKSNIKQSSIQIYKIKNITNLYENIDIAISSVGNTAFELGYIGIPTIHFTIEKRETKRAKIFSSLNLAKFTGKDLKMIIDELNKIYFDDNYRKNLVKRRKNFFRKKNKLLKIINDSF
jgi:spore coat polysaccharide biosynthesis predicted glycosyltransferase SpsG